MTRDSKTDRPTKGLFPQHQEPDATHRTYVSQKCAHNTQHTTHNTQHTTQPIWMNKYIS